jgi:uncharacterized protein (DUF983 family)
MDTRASQNPSVPFLRALRRRCPACGRGRIFRSLLRLRRACDACGWIVEREPGAVTGAMYVVSVLTLVFAAVLFGVTWAVLGWRPWLQIAVGVPVLTVFSLFALPAARAMWAAIDYATDVATGETAREDYAASAYETRADQRP